MGCGTPVFFEAEVMPTPVEGNEKLLKDLNATITLRRHEKGNFNVDIQMNCRGQTRNIQLYNSEFNYLKEDKIFTFFSLVKFNPAKQQGRKVNCTFHYLVTYKKGNFTEVKIQPGTSYNGRMR